MSPRLLWFGLAAFLLALVIVLPVRWVAGMVPKQVHCASWSGSVWRGQCSGLVVQQGGAPIEVEALSWKLHPASLLRLAIKADFNIRTTQGTGSGVAEMGRHGLIVVDDLAVNAVFDRRLATMLAEGWKGQLEARRVSVRMQGNALQKLSGEIALRDFTDSKGAAFGSYRLELPPVAAPPFTGTITDTGGPLELMASVSIGADRQWQLDALITPRPDASADLRSNLDRIATQDANGRYRLLSEGSFR